MKTTTVVAVAIVAVLIVGALSLNYYFAPSPNVEMPDVEVPDVKITNFTCLGTWHGTALGSALDLFSLNYTNLGNTDVEN